MPRDQRTTLSFTKEGKDMIKRLAASQGISQAVYLELLARKDAEEKADKARAS
jgi:hypothetical protein